jgi:hypothetical protein
MENIIESSVNAEPVANVEPQEPQVETTVNESVNAEGGEVATPQQIDKPVQDAETNSMYAKIRKEAEAKAKDEAIAEMGIVWNGQPIKTYAQYKKALEEKAEYNRRNALQEQGIDPEVFDKYVNENPMVQWAKEQMEKQKREEQQWQDFLNVKKDFGIKEADEIPPEVFKYQDDTGTSLYNAMVWYDRNQLKTKIAEYEKGNVTKEANNKNAASATGSLQGQGAVTHDYISKDQFEANKSNQQWMLKNYEVLKKSMNKW